MPAAAVPSLSSSDLVPGTEAAPPAHSFAARLAYAVQTGDLDAADRMARAIACVTPDDSTIAVVSRIMPASGNLHTRAAVGRMAQILDPNDAVRTRERLHRSIKANRPDLMPPHWTRDVMFEARALQAKLQSAGLSAALGYIQNDSLDGHHLYMPRFRALRHFVLFNTVPRYQSAFLQDGVKILKIAGEDYGQGNVDANEALLDSMVKVVNWNETSDTIAIADQQEAVGLQIRKRMRAGRLPNHGLPENIQNFRNVLANAFWNYWNTLKNLGFIPELFGFSEESSLDVVATMILHVNEILEGPVLGPHYHSGYRYDDANFPLLSGVYYPRTIPRNDESKAGYLEFGRPDFVVEFEPSCVTHRPVAGDLVLFPAFAYHGVVPIDQAPRFSVNIDVFLKPKNATTWSVAEFFGNAR